LLVVTYLLLVRPFFACLLTQPGNTNELAKKDQELVAIEPPSDRALPYGLPFSISLRVSKKCGTGCWA